MNSIRWPDFFIIGAPKCGTTSLFEYLSENANLHVIPAKEIHFFGADLKWRRRFHPRERYRELIDGASVGTPVGEASVFYLMSKTAAAEISNVAPTAKILIMVRDPIEMIHSLYVEGLRSGTESEMTLEKALAVEPERRLSGTKLSKENPGLEESTYYSEVARYHQQILRYLDEFPKSQIKVILFEDFKSDPAKVYSEVCSFLGVTTKTLQKFAVHNRHRAITNVALWRMIKHPPAGLRSIWRALFPRWFRSAILSRVSGLYLREQPKEMIDLKVRKKIHGYYESDVAKLGRLLDRDLSHWLKLE